MPNVQITLSGISEPIYWYQYLYLLIIPIKLIIGPDLRNTTKFKYSTNLLMKTNKLYLFVCFSNSFPTYANYVKREICVKENGI